MSWATRRTDRDIAAEVTGRLPSRRRGALHDRLRTDAQARARYDLHIAAQRELERRDPCAHELDLVEGWLFADAQPAREPAAGLSWAVPLMAAACATVLVLAWPRTEPAPDDLVARGSAGAGGLGIQVLCETQAGRVLEAADKVGCPMQGRLTFAYRTDARLGSRHLTVFGVDARGSVLYYAPTPIDPRSIVTDFASPSTEGAAWQPIPFSIDVATNHGPGPVRVFVLLADFVPSVADIDEAAAELHAAADAPDGTVPWHQRLPDSTALSRRCRDDRGCLSVHTSFVVYEDRP